MSVKRNIKDAKIYTGTQRERHHLMYEMREQNRTEQQKQQRPNENETIKMLHDIYLVKIGVLQCHAYTYTEHGIRRK